MEDSDRQAETDTDTERERDREDNTWIDEVAEVRKKVKVKERKIDRSD